MSVDVGEHYFPPKLGAVAADSPRSTLLYMTQFYCKYAVLLLHKNVLPRPSD
jgi:hypothetical protein